MEAAGMIRRLLKGKDIEEKVAGAMLLVNLIDKHADIDKVEEFHESDMFDSIQLLMVEAVESLSPVFLMRMLQSKNTNEEVDDKIHATALQLLLKATDPSFMMTKVVRSGESVISLYRGCVDTMLTVAFHRSTTKSSTKSLLTILQNIALCSNRLQALTISCKIVEMACQQKTRDPILVLEIFTELVCVYSAPDSFLTGSTVLRARKEGKEFPSSSSSRSRGKAFGVMAGMSLDDEMEFDQLLHRQSSFLRSIIVQCLHGAAGEDVRDRTLTACLALMRNSVDEMSPYYSTAESNDAHQGTILSVWWSIEQQQQQLSLSSSEAEGEIVAAGKFPVFLSSIIHGELHLLLEEAFGLFGNLEDGNLEGDHRGGEGSTPKKKEQHKERSLRAIRLLWIVLSLVDHVLLLLIGVTPAAAKHVGGDDYGDIEGEGGLGGGDVDDGGECIGVWSELPPEFVDKVHNNLNNIVGEMVSFVKEISMLKRSLGVMPQMLSNIVCRVARSLTGLAAEDQSYFSALLSHLELLLDASRIPTENMAQLVASSNVDEATVGDTAAILCGKTLYKKYLIVPGSHSVYRDTSVSALVENTSLSTTPAEKRSVHSNVATASRNVLSTLDGFDLAFHRNDDALNPDYNWNLGQGDVLQHLLPCLMSLSTSYLFEINAGGIGGGGVAEGFDDVNGGGDGGLGGALPSSSTASESSRYGEILLTQLCASPGFCCRLLSCTMVACAYINTHHLIDLTNSDNSGGDMEGHHATFKGTESADRKKKKRNDDEDDNDDDGGGGGGGGGGDKSKMSTKTDLLRKREVAEFARLCDTARMAVDQLNVLLEYSMGSDHGPQDQKMFEAIVKPESGVGRNGGGGANDVPTVQRNNNNSNTSGNNYSGNISTSVCSMPPQVWTNLFRNLRLLTASLRSKVKTITFHDDKAGSVSTMLFSLDELDSTVACLQPLLSL
jgi:hypothetical protein